MKIHQTAVTMAVALAGLLCAGPTARAADDDATARRARPAAAGDRATRARDQLQQIAQQLNLTEEQKAQLRPILQKEREKQAEKVKALRTDTSLSPEQRREKAQAIRKEIQTDLAPEFKKVLTVEQYEKWQKIREQRARPAGSEAPRKARPGNATQP